MPIKRDKKTKTYTWYASEAQKRAIIFCEKWLKIEFTGKIDDYKDVCDFLDENFKKAQQRADYVTKRGARI